MHHPLLASLFNNSIYDAETGEKITNQMLTEGSSRFHHLTVSSVELVVMVPGFPVL